MRLERFGIVLRSMVEQDLEMVRQWRNAPHVRENMEFRDEIPPEMQQKWFKSLNQDSNLYLIAESEGIPFAVLHVKDINWENRSGEAGIFVGEVGFLQTFVPVLAVLAMMDLVFDGWGFRQLMAKVRADRPQIMDFNARLGYSPLPDQDGMKFIRLKTNLESYRYAAKVLRRQARTFQNAKLKLEIRDEDFPGKWQASAAELEATFLLTSN